MAFTGQWGRGPYQSWAVVSLEAVLQPSFSFWKMKQMSYSKVLLLSILRPVLFSARHSPRVWYLFLFWSFSWDTLSRSWSTVMSSSSRRLGMRGWFRAPAVLEPASLMSPVLAGGSFTTSTTWEAHNSCVMGIPSCYIQMRTEATFRGNWAWEKQHLLLRQGALREKYLQRGKFFSRFNLLFPQSHTCYFCPFCRNPIDL